MVKAPAVATLLVVAVSRVAMPVLVLEVLMPVVPARFHAGQAVP